MAMAPVGDTLGDAALEEALISSDTVVASPSGVIPGVVSEH